MEVFGKFELLSCLARGGMAEVFLARQRGEGRFERLVVIKRILPELASKARFVELFLEEARIAALLEHPNVVPIYDLGRIDGAYFLAMPYVRGLTIQALLKEATQRQVGIPTEVGCEVVRQALGGLRYVHGRAGLDGTAMRLVHRDVSPSNLIINEQGRTQLLDFGIAWAGDSGNSGPAVYGGKLAYMSPEQVLGEDLDNRSDLFSLGVVLYELVVGRRLFQRADDQQVVDAITREPLADPRHTRPDLPADLAHVILRALARDREQRYGEAAEMAAELEIAVRPMGADRLARFIGQHFGDLLAEQDKRVEQARQGIVAQDDAPTRVDLPARKARPTAEAGAATAAPAAPSRRRLLLAGAGAAVLLGGGAATFVLSRRPAQPHGPPLRMGVIPFLPEPVLKREWRPLLRYLGQRVGRPVKLVVSLSYRKVMDALLDGRVDFADLSAYPFLLARRKDPRIQILALGITPQGPTYRANLVVRKQDKAKDIADLAGERICYVDRTSTSGYLVPRLMVRRAGHDPDKFFASFQFSGDHYRALRDLLAERCDVASVASSSFKTASKQGIPVDQVRVLATSKPLPHGVYCASSQLPRAIADRLRRAFLELDVQKEFGRANMGEHVIVRRFVPFERRYFEDLDHELSRLLARDAGDGGPAR